MYQSIIWSPRHERGQITPATLPVTGGAAGLEP
jgi:hypothetical protein